MRQLIFPVLFGPRIRHLDDLLVLLGNDVNLGLKWVTGAEAFCATLAHGSRLFHGEENFSSL